VGVRSDEVRSWPRRGDSAPAPAPAPAPVLLSASNSAPAEPPRCSAAASCGRGEEEDEEERGSSSGEPGAAGSVDGPSCGERPPTSAKLLPSRKP